MKNSDVELIQRVLPGDHGISHIKPVTPSISKPLISWVVTASTLAVVFLMLGNIATSSEESRTEENVKDYTKWELPKAAKARLGKGKVNDIKFTPDGKHLAVETAIGVWLYDTNTGEEIALFTDVGDDNQRLDRSYINMLVSVTDANTIECPGLDGDKDLGDLEKDSLKSILPYLRRRNNVLQFKASNIKLAYSGWRMNLPWHGRAGLWISREDENESIESISLLKVIPDIRITISPDERFLAAAR